MDEYNTSKKCHKCLKTLGNYHPKHDVSIEPMDFENNEQSMDTNEQRDQRKVDLRKATLYDEEATGIPYSKLKICVNCDKEGLVQQRDKNASINILKPHVYFIKKVVFSF